MSLTELHNKKKARNLSTASTEDLENELSRRGAEKNPFPLDVFHKRLHPYLNALHEKYDFHKSYIGLNMLSVVSTAVGTSYVYSSNDLDDVYLSVWGCHLGLTSSGKSFCTDKVFEPLRKLQNEQDKLWEEKTRGMSDDKTRYENMPTYIYRDSHMPTLIRYVLPDNPKGVCKMSDELLEWINGMDATGRGNKEGTDEQVWLSIWNCKDYNAIRSNKVKISLRRPFINVIGGIQDVKLPKLFGNNRDHSGFIFRVLFARDDRNIMINNDPDYAMEYEIQMVHDGCINAMMKYMNVESSDDTPGKCIPDKEAQMIFRAFCDEMRIRVNNTEEKDRNIHAGIAGKMKEYTMRFAALLHLQDKVIDGLHIEGDYNHKLRMKEKVNAEVMHRAVKLARYFYQSAWDAYEMVENLQFAPIEVQKMAMLYKNFYLTGKNSYAELGDRMQYPGTKDAKAKRFKRSLDRNMVKYGWLFNSERK